MFLGSSEYLSTALRCSTKPFTKRLGCCGGKSLNVPFFTLLLTPFSLPWYCLFCVFLGFFGYPRTPWRCSTKLFTKRLGCCGGKSQYVHFLPLCWPHSWYLNLVHFAKHCLKKLTIHKTVESCGGKSLDVHCFTLILTTFSVPQSRHCMPAHLANLSSFFLYFTSPSLLR